MSLDDEGVVETIFNHPERDEIIDELLDIALTTLNVDRIDPLDGAQLAKFVIEGKKTARDCIKLLLHIASNAEPSRTERVLSLRGIAKEV